MFVPRLAKVSDKDSVIKLYRKVAHDVGGIAREETEITDDYVKNFMCKSVLSGIELVVDHPENKGEIIAEVHCYKPEPKVFHHILSDLTVVVHPDFQGKGLGRILFQHLLKLIEDKAEVLRVELIARESNQKAIEFYKTLGFKIEGRMEGRIYSNGSFEADIPMAYVKNLENC
jgi:ribosomal protein S18 acetylase RimI-like enzyme